MLSATVATPPRTFRGTDGYVCACLRITEQQLLDTLASTPTCSLRDLRRTIGAGDGCTACHDTLRQYLDAGRQPSSPPIRSDR